MIGLQGLEPETEGVHGAGRERLHDDIGPSGEVPRDGAAAFGAQVELDRVLAGADQVPQRGVLDATPVGEERTGRSDDVDAAFALDAYDGGTVVGEEPRGHGSGDDPREIEHAQAFEGPTDRHARSLTRARPEQHVVDVAVVLAQLRRRSEAPERSRRRHGPWSRHADRAGRAGRLRLADGELVPVPARVEMLVGQEIGRRRHRSDEQPSLARRGTAPASFGSP